MNVEIVGDELLCGGSLLLELMRSDDPPGLRAEVRRTPRGEGWEFGLEWTNVATMPKRIDVLDALTARLSAPDRWRAQWFASAWGSEFEPVESADVEGLHIEVRSGRSSHGAHPLLLLASPDAAVIVTIAWSGNWRFEVDRSGVLRAGISRHDFGVVLQPGEVVRAPSVLLAAGRDLAEAGRRLSGAVGEGIPRSAWSESMPTEWNHWWPFEDQDIDEPTFLREALAARSLGVDVATLDAGWFGSSKLDADWQAERGDWGSVNVARFPSGLEKLAADTRSSGAEFGIWIEPEAVGAAARLRNNLPELIATRSRPDTAAKITVSLDATDPTFLGYVCLGSPAGRGFVLESMVALVETTGARWLKLDFNVDPGSGCDRIDHGHGADDGLFRHYEGLYEVLDAFRDRHPDVILESCSSGGLRMDVGIARHVHCQFLSDLDWTEHHLQVLWAASLILPPAAILHWSWSQWRGEHPDQRRDLAMLSAVEFDRELRAAMLHRFGVSFIVTDMSPPLAERLALHLDDYRRLIAPVLRRGVLTARTEQPLRHGRGERRPVFQVDDGTAHLLAVFDLDAREGHVQAGWSGLDAHAEYDVYEVAAGLPTWRATGAELMRGTSRPGVSWLALARRVETPPA